jgi:hypothetical protein
MTNHHQLTGATIATIYYLKHSVNKKLCNLQQQTKTKNLNREYDQKEKERTKKKKR